MSSTINTEHIFNNFEINHVEDKLKDIKTNPSNYPYNHFKFINTMLIELDAPKSMFDVFLMMQYFFKIQRLDLYINHFNLFLKIFTLALHKEDDELKEKYKELFCTIMYIESLFPDSNN